MTHSTNKVITIAVTTLIVVALISLCIHVYACDSYFVNYLDGFWVGDTVDGQVLFYFDNDSLRIVESNGVLETSMTDKCKYKINKKTWFSMYDRSYDLILTETNKVKSKIGKLLIDKKIVIDLFSIEGTCIIRDDKKDIVTLVKDIHSNLSLLV